MSWDHDFLNLLFPRLCPACGNTLVKKEGVICMHCMYDLPRTRFNNFQDNVVARLFWGRVKLENATSCFNFQSGSRYQRLIHELKYGGRTDIGLELGRITGLELVTSSFADVDIILPVPLHPRKKRRRGYNQSDYIAEGLSGILGVPARTGLIEKHLETSSQTDKSRLQRWENVEHIFRVPDPVKLENLHVLLVDDVVTSGATLDACATAILQVEGCRASIATPAYTGKIF